MALFSIAVLASFSASGKGKVKTMGELWTAYEDAIGNDRIQKASDILEDIKEMALKQRRTWDFYDAWRKYVDCCSRRDWKRREELSAQMDAEVRAYGEPVLDFLLDIRDMEPEEMMEKIEAGASELRLRKNTDVYEGYGTVYGDVIVPTVRNDHEFVLWTLYASYVYRGKYSEMSYRMLHDELGDVYPQAGLAEYHYLTTRRDEEGLYDGLKNLAERHEGKALALLACQNMERIELESAADKEDSEYFEDFRDRLQDYIRLRNSYRTGVEKLIADKCEGFDMLVRHLDEESLSAKIADGKAELHLRNIDRLKIRILEDGEKILETVLDNPVRSYYAKDTLKFDMQDLDDGNYVMEFLSGSRKLGERQYQKYTLSMAGRQDAEGFAIYVADYKTGRPVECVDLEIVRSGRVVRTVKDFKLAGFTGLPESLSAFMNDSGKCYIRCVAEDESGRIMKSKSTLLRGSDAYDEGRVSSVSAEVMFERCAYNPGETVRFKAVMYEIPAEGTMRTVGEGTEVTAELRGPKNTVVRSEKLYANEFGSVAGGFPLDEVELNGGHVVVIRSTEGKVIGSRMFTVDEYVLPTFDIVFDTPEKVFHEGEEVVVSGRIRSFAGHPLSSADVEAVVSLDDKVVLKEELSPASDGSFMVSFKDEIDEDNDYRAYSVEVKVTELTGETKSFSFTQPVLTKPVLRVSLDNPAEGSASLEEGLGGSVQILADEVARVSCDARYRYGMMECNGLPLEYKLLEGGRTVVKGTVDAGNVLDIPFEGFRSGLYRFVLSYEDTETGLYILKIREGDRHVCPEVENVFHKIDCDGVKVRFGAGCAPVWAVVELFDDKRRLLESDAVCLEKGEVTVLDFGKGYETGVRMNVLYFRDGQCYTYSESWAPAVPPMELPLSFASFRDETVPGTECSLSMNTCADAEVLVSVFDTATEKIRPNHWRTVRRRTRTVPSVSVYRINGMDGNIAVSEMGRKYHLYMYDMMEDFVTVEESMVVGYGSRVRGLTRSKMTGDAMYAAAESNDADEAVPFQLADELAPSADGIREDFSASLAFEPFLRPDGDGLVTMDFKTSDKTSTYVVSVFAHDKDMNNSVLRGEMLVTLPVMVSLAQPQYLYSGDRYVLNASVSNTSLSAVDGKVSLDVFGGDDYKSGTPLVSRSADLEVQAGNASKVSFELEVPSGLDTLGFRLVFTGTRSSPKTDDLVSDGLFVTVPVYQAEQVVVEAHSALLLDGMSEEDLLRDLRSRFVNGTSTGAEYSVISVMDMLYDALPLVAEAESRDAISLSEAMYVNMLAAGLRAEAGEPVREYIDAAMSMASKILACRDVQGGFAWFEGMDASPAVTAVVLERFAGIRDRGLLRLVAAELGEDSADAYADAMKEAVLYLDRNYFGDSGRPLWSGRLSLWQYINVRSMYAGVPFDEAAARKAAGSKEFKEFEKSVKACLTPADGEVWTHGAILSKARMLNVLQALSSSEKGLALARAWGLSGRAKALRKSMRKELESLKEYAVEHSSGGIYYPNAVLPFRGLLESEAYAHAMISDLFRELSTDEEFGEGLAEMADGIRLWIMLQKETQEWKDDPGFVEAMSSVYDASDAVKSAKVVVLVKRFIKPFDEVKAAGNGFKVSVSFFRDGQLLADGDTLHVGDRVTAKYSLWSGENRSFVRLSVPRPACLRPESQLSGWSGGFLRPFAYGIYSMSPCAYREVKADMTLYWIDVFPEEDSSIEEDMYVTQEGVFCAPVAEIQSVYAPHYRANDGFRGLYMVD